MITSFFETLGYKLALRRINRRDVVSLPGDLSRRQLLLVLPSDETLIDAALSLVQQIELPAEQVQLVSVGEEAPSNAALDRYPVRHVGRNEYDWFGLPSTAICGEVLSPSPHVAIDLNVDFVLPAACLVGRSPAPFRIGIHHPEAEPFRDILYRYDGADKEAYHALRRILYNIEPAILPMQPMSTRVFY